NLLALFYEEGIGVIQDYNKALELYQLLADNGDKDAKKKVKEVKKKIKKQKK
ncbi:MAG: SEL1-like repeat protein, partial [Bacteroidales bacterium]|nr:SEL1-like repeat protein [Bacteroidales bacterium]